jgi:hypothetical protein
MLINVTVQKTCIERGTAAHYCDLIGSNFSSTESDALSAVRVMRKPGHSAASLSVAVPMYMSSGAATGCTTTATAVT